MAIQYLDKYVFSIRLHAQTVKSWLAVREFGMIRILLGMSVLCFGVTTVAAEDARVKFPQNYKKDFTNYLSLDRVQNPDQIIRLFANSAAADSRTTGGDMPDGAVLVGEIYAAKKDKDGEVVVSRLGRRIRDKLVAIAVMEKRKGWGDKIPAEFRNGDWDFGIFAPDGKPLNKDLNACRSCHAPLADTQHLFSLEHLIR